MKTNTATVCGFCGRPTLGSHVCPQCESEEELPPCIGTGFQRKLDEQFDRIFRAVEVE